MGALLWLIEQIFLTSNLQYKATEEITDAAFQIILCFLSFFFFYCNDFGSAELIKVASLSECSLVSDKINIMLPPPLISEKHSLVAVMLKKSKLSLLNWMYLYRMGLFSNSWIQIKMK